MATKSKSSGFVTVACKLPQGLNISVPDTDIKLKLHGTHSPYAVAGHGLTEVKADVWDAVEAHYKDVPGAKWLGSSVFVSSKREDAVDEATEKADENYGFDPIDPTAPGSVNKGIAVAD
jgi:hypothetical protein